MLDFRTKRIQCDRPPNPSQDRYHGLAVHLIAALDAHEQLPVVERELLRRKHQLVNGEVAEFGGTALLDGLGNQQRDVGKPVRLRSVVRTELCDCFRIVVRVRHGRVLGRVALIR